MKSNLDGEEKKYHSPILSFLPFFHSHFQASILMRRDGRNHHTNLSSHAFESLMRYFYLFDTSHFKAIDAIQLLGEKDGIPFYLACEKEGGEDWCKSLLQTLTSRCEEFDRESCMEVLLFSLRSGNIALQEKCSSFLSQNQDLLSEIDLFDCEDQLILYKFTTSLFVKNNNFLLQQNESLRKEIDSLEKEKISLEEKSSLEDKERGEREETLLKKNALLLEQILTKEKEVKTLQKKMDVQNELYTSLVRRITCGNQIEKARLLGNEKDLDKSIECFKGLASKGNEKAMLNLAILFLSEKKDYSLGIEYLERCVSQGNLQARAFLADCYFRGEGVDKDLDKCQKLLEGAEEERGNIIASLGIVCEEKGQFAEAEVHYKRASELGCAEASLLLANLYFEGRDSFSRNLGASYSYYEKACEQGSVVAAFNLGMLLQNGEENGTNDSIAKDLDKAVFFYQKASDMGLDSATYKLGVIHLKGEKKNLPKALQYLKKSSEMNNQKSMNYLAKLYLSAEGKPHLFYFFFISQLFVL